MSRLFFNMNSIINSELSKSSKHNEATNAPEWICTFQIPGVFTVLLFHGTDTAITDTLIMGHLPIHLSCIALAHLIIYTHIYILINTALFYANW